MAVLYVKMRAKGTCGVRTRARSQSDTVLFTEATAGLFMNHCTGALDGVYRVELYQPARARVDREATNRGRANLAMADNGDGMTQTR
eukprot:COSAG03_NODE_80_length_14027_cov_69.115953_9_plen_87_part_00